MGHTRERNGNRVVSDALVVYYEPGEHEPYLYASAPPCQDGRAAGPTCKTAGRELLFPTRRLAVAMRRGSLRGADRGEREADETEQHAEAHDQRGDAEGTTRS